MKNTTKYTITTITGTKQTQLLSENAVTLWIFFKKILPLNQPQIIPLSQIKIGLSYHQIKTAGKELVEKGIVDRHTFTIMNSTGSYRQTTWRLLSTTEP